MTHPTIIITTRWNGATAWASTFFDGKSITEEGRTHAHAISNAVSRLARFKDAQGVAWSSPDHGLSGVVGASTKVKRRRSISEMPGFELHGGQMRS